MRKKEAKDLFKGRRLLIATKHKKESVIAPVLEEAMGVYCFTNTDFDTDLFGTFTGEIERKDDGLATARNKCHQAMELTNCDMAIASEGSFGPHPAYGLVNADDEILVFVDKKNSLEISARVLSLRTNFNSQTVNSEEELLKFAAEALFPSHGLILRKSDEDHSETIKGITEPEQLKNSFRLFKKKYNSCYVQTDMRAMFNPTRMEVIEEVTKKFSQKINSLCPNCNKPGFGVTGQKKGLPCNLCGFPTKSTLAYEYKCQICDFTEEKKFPNGKYSEEPMFCDICNP